MSVAERLAEITWQVVEGDFATLERLVIACDGSWEETEDGTYVATTAAGVTVGFVPGMDPIGAHAQTMMALLGQLWAMVPDARDAMVLVRKRWRAATQARRAVATR